MVTTATSAGQFTRTGNHAPTPVVTKRREGPWRNRPARCRCVRARLALGRFFMAIWPMVFLGQALEKGVQGWPRDPELATRCFRRAADEGSAKAWAELGVFFAWADSIYSWPRKPVAKNLDEAVRCYRRGANLDNAGRISRA